MLPWNVRVLIVQRWNGASGRQRNLVLCKREGLSLSRKSHPAGPRDSASSGGSELILPDIHLHWKLADRIIQHESRDRVWLLGDYFDDYNDTTEQVEETCKWLLGTCEDHRICRLLGNHDVYYFCDNKSYRGAGYSRDKHQLIQKYFSPRMIREKFILYARARGYLLTHAGFSGRWLKKFSEPLIDRYLEEAFQALLRNELHPLIDIGTDRGGWNEVGGVTWCDWRNFKPIAGLPQILGHTYAKRVRWAGFERCGHSDFKFDHCVAGSFEEDQEPTFALKDEVSLCLDTGLRHYAVIDGSGLVHLKQTPSEFLESSG